MNFQLVHGRLGKDAEVFGEADKPIVKFSVATSEYIGKDRDGKAQYSETEWTDVICLGFIGKKARDLGLQKGDSVVVWGQKNTRVNEKDGKKYYNTNLKADMVVLEYVPEKQ
jgi:single-strand DNA-binding protein